MSIEHLPDDELQQQLLELAYDLLADDEAVDLRHRIDTDPVVAQAYAEAQRTARLLEAASSLAAPPIELARPDEVSLPGAVNSHAATPLPRAIRNTRLRRWAAVVAVGLLVGLALDGLVLGVAWRAFESSPTRSAAAPQQLASGIGNPLAVPTNTLDVLPQSPQVVGPNQPRQPDQPVPQQVAEHHNEIVAVNTGLPRPAQSAQRLPSPSLFTQLSVDRPVYQPGDTLFFRSLTLHRFSFDPADDIVVYFEILDPSGSLLAGSSHSYTTEHGVTSGLSPLSRALPGGQYTLHAYSSSGQFEDQKRTFFVRQYRLPRLKKDFEFTRDSYAPGDHVVADVSVDRADGTHAAGATLRSIATVDGKTVYDGSRALEKSGKTQVEFQLPRGIERGDGQLAIIVDDGGTQETIAKTIRINVGRIDVSFYPEGGELVAGLENRVYFVGRTPLGKPAHLEGQIVDSTGHAVAVVKTAHKGMGSFAFTPRAGQSYSLKLNNPPKVSTLPELPAVNPERHVVLSTSPGVFEAGQPLVVELRSDRDDLPITLTANCRGVLVGQQMAALHKGSNRLTVPLAAEAGGVVRLTVLQQLAQADAIELSPIAERLVYRRPARALNVKISGLREHYAPGEPVELSLAVTNERGEPTPAVLGVSVVPETIWKMVEEETPKMTTQLYLTSEIDKPEDLEKADFYLSTDPQAPAALDLLLGTQGWRRFVEQSPAQTALAHADKPGGSAVTQGQPRAAAPTSGTIAPPSYVFFGNSIQIAPTYNSLDFSYPPVPETDSVQIAGQTTHFPQLSAFPHAVPQAPAPRDDGLIPTQSLLNNSDPAYDVHFGPGVTVATPSVLGPIGDTNRVGSPADINLVGTSIISDSSAATFAMALGTQYSAPSLTTASSGTAGSNTPAQRSTVANSFLDPMIARMDLYRRQHPPLSYNLNVNGATSLGGTITEGQNVWGDDAVNTGAGALQTVGSGALTLASSTTYFGGASTKLGAGTLTVSGSNNINLGATTISGGTLTTNGSNTYSGGTAIPSGTLNVTGIVLNSTTSTATGSLDANMIASGAGGFALNGGGQMDINGGGLAVGGIAAQSGGGGSAYNYHVNQSAESQPAPAREYAHVHLAEQPDVRSDFAETLLWQPMLITDADGHAKVKFELNDAVGSFRLVADAHCHAAPAGQGRIGTASTQIVSQIPVSFEPTLPLEVTAGDRIEMPVAVANDTPSELPVELSLSTASLIDSSRAGGREVESLLGLDGPRKQSLTLAAKTRQRVYFPLAVTGHSGAAQIELRGQAGKLADARQQTLSVVPSGYPRSASYSGYLHGRTDLRINIPRDYVSGSLAVSLRAFPSPLADIQQGIDSILREPSGCFEQTSASNYPNVLALEYLQEQKLADPDLTRRAKELLRHGYERLIGFECRGGGFEWFGHDPAHEALTAFGLLEFREMARVTDVDPALIERTAKWLLSRRDGQGHFYCSTQGLHTFATGQSDIVDAYIVWALSESGQEGIELELKHVLAVGHDSSDPYLIALAAASALDNNDAADGRDLLERLAKSQEPNGRLVAQGTSITHSGGVSLEIETTALAGLAWLKLPDYRDHAKRAIDWIAAHRQDWGGFGSTQATVLALKLLVEAARLNHQAVSGGTLAVERDGQSLGRASFAAGEWRTIVIDGLGEQLQPGDDNLTLTLSGDNRLAYALDVHYRSLTGPSSDSCPLRLTTRLAADHVRAGETVALDAELLNTTGADQPMSIAILGLPAGLEPRTSQLEELKKAGTIDFYETRAREVICYWRSLAPRQRIAVKLDLVATCPGQYTGPASRAYLYYTAEQKQWTEPLRVTISRE